MRKREREKEGRVEEQGRGKEGEGRKRKGGREKGKEGCVRVWYVCVREGVCSECVMCGGGGILTFLCSSPLSLW